MATNLFAALLVWFFLYESAGLSLESVDLMYSDPGVAAWKSSKWAPAGWFSRTKRTNEPLLLDPETAAKKEDELPIFKKYSTTSSTAAAGPGPGSSRAQSTSTNNGASLAMSVITMATVVGC